MTDLPDDARTVRAIAHRTLGPGAAPKRAARARYYEAVAAVERAHNAGGGPTPEQAAEERESYAAFRRAMGWAG